MFFYVLYLLYVQLTVTKVLEGDTTRHKTFRMLKLLHISICENVKQTLKHILIRVFWFKYVFPIKSAL